ncbi:MAG: hypothetical protein IIA88_01565 [Bacteroidetes bacterium]|nr:hypothetical protein [Bacteroidota bacterium]
MKTVQLLVNEEDYLKYGFSNNSMKLSEFREKIEIELFQKSINKSLKIAKETGLSEMSLKDINAEIEKVRKGA